MQEVAHRHAAMIQLDPRGSMAFFHRTSDAKLDPECNYSADFHIADYISVPLTPGRATSVLGGSLILGPLGAQAPVAPFTDCIKAVCCQ